MSHDITIRPSGHHVDNHPGESLLESALNAGLSVDYGCSNGNCGKCRARLVSGAIDRLHHSDFVFTPAEKNEGWFLMCCHAAATDAVIDTGLAAGSDDIERQRIDVKVRKIAPLDDRHTLLHVQTPRTRRLRFLAGQSAMLSSGGAILSLPIASCPCDDRNIHFHLDNESDADALAALRVGATLRLEGPLGDFVLDAASPRARIMIGAGRGLAPLKSIAEHSLALAPDVAVALLLFEPEGDPHYLRGWFRSWRDALDDFTFEAAGLGQVARAVGGFAASPTPAD
ncbi:MAG: hypothetical protein DWQ08_07460, partial [Proteobacteria bacterium]